MTYVYLPYQFCKYFTKHSIHDDIEDVFKVEFNAELCFFVADNIFTTEIKTH